MKFPFCRDVVLAAASVALFFCSGGISAQTDEKAGAAMPTPTLADGHPDLSGAWDIVNRDAKENTPPYKPEALAKVKELNRAKAQKDPEVSCIWTGVPRVGPPQQILQNSILTVFLYADRDGEYSRLVPTDGRPHRDDIDPSSMGDSVGHWEGNTLVVDVTMIDGNTWPGPNGWFHSENSHLVERLARVGNVIHYEATLEDPDFAKPWQLTPRTLVLKTSQDVVHEMPICVSPGNKGP